MLFDGAREEVLGTRTQFPRHSLNSRDSQQRLEETVDKAIQTDSNIKAIVWRTKLKGYMIQNMLSCYRA